MQKHIDILREGADKWNAWRKTHPDIVPDFTDARLEDITITGANLEKAKFIRAVISQVHLRRSEFSDADFSNATIKNCDFSDSTLCRSKLVETRCTNVQLTNTNLSLVEFSGGIFDRVHFSSAQGFEVRALEPATPPERDAPLRTMLFRKESRPRFRGCKFDGCHFTNASLFATFERCAFVGAQFELADFSQSRFRKCDLSAAAFDGSKFKEAEIEHCNFRKASLKSVSFIEAQISDTDFRGALLNDKSSLEGAKLKHVRCRREDLAAIHGALVKSLSPNQIQNIDIGPDLAILKRDFTGFKRAMHLFALALFVAPYIFFLLAVEARHEALRQIFAVEDHVRERIAAQNLHLSTNHVFLLGDASKRKHPTRTPAFQIWQHIRSRSTIQQSLFYFLVAYNILRLLLLYKTTRLEHEEQVTGLESNFSFQSALYWRLLYVTMTRLSSVYYALVLIHTVSELNQPLFYTFRQ
jgi:uncharacterized protein YjbI with pentapeptide repeats